MGYDKQPSNLHYYYTLKQKKFWEELITYFPFTTYEVFDTKRTA
jgi:hypothetical protein